MNALFGVLKVLLMLAPTYLTLYLLIQYFPYTGLGRIAAIPAILTVNIAIIITGQVISARYTKKSWKTLFRAAFILLTMFVAVALYPQESGPHVMNRIWDAVSGKRDGGKTASLPISNQDVVSIKLWGDGLDGKEANAEERGNILKWLNSVEHFEKEESIPSEMPAPLSSIIMHLKTGPNVSIRPWGDDSMLLNGEYSFGQTELSEFLRELADPS